MILKLAVFFLLLSLIAASFGYGGMASASAGIACLLFFLAIAIFVIRLIAALVIGRAWAIQWRHCPATAYHGMLDPTG
jgi:uncharacterized membrane protein YtjA (UPF0391 family)